MQETLSFGPWLKQRRRFLDLTQEELAQRAACSLSTLRKIEAGDLLPSKELARLLAAALGVPDAEQEAFIAFARDERRTALTPAFIALPPVPPFPQAPSIATPARRHSLPTQLTPLIGRATEIAELQQRLANPACALLTIVGPGGIGKTRLALAVAHTLAEEQQFSDGLYFVPFVGVTAPEFMISTLANAIGFSFANMGDPKEQLFNYLRAKTMLLVLDNLEHLLDGVDLLVEILQTAPEVKLLTTSRERLAVAGEWVFELPTLPTPPQSKELVAVANYAAVALFVERAQRTQHDFALSAENDAAVAQLCRLVGGMPLALELAASWVHTLSCAEIVKEIEQSLDFLAVNHRNLPERQRSVRATFDHSWRLLSAAEQQVLRRLAVFRGGFQREAAVQVAGATLPVLASLVNKSLVRRTEEGRYDLHELVRQYAAEYLSHDPQAARQTCNAHADHFLGGLDDQRGLFNHQHQATYQTLVREQENLRIAWLWAAERGRYDLLHRATPTFWYFHTLRFLLHEGQALFTQALQLLPSQDSGATEIGTEIGALPRIVANSLNAGRGWFQFRTGQGAEARALVEQAVTKLRQETDPAVLADALLYLSIVEWLRAACATAQQYAEEALALNRQLGRHWQAATCLTSLGSATYLTGAYPAANEYFTESLAIFRQVGEPRSIALAIVTVGAATRAAGQLAEAKLLLQEGLLLAQALDHGWTIALIQQSMGLIAAAKGETDEAQQLLGLSLHFFRTRGDVWFTVDTLNMLGWLHLQAGRLPEAQPAFAEALQLAYKAEAIPSTLNALLGLATLQAQTMPLPLHLLIANHAVAHPVSTLETQSYAEQLRLRLEAMVDPSQIEVTRRQAQQATLESLVAAILSS